MSFLFNFQRVQCISFIGFSIEDFSVGTLAIHPKILMIYVFNMPLRLHNNDKKKKHPEQMSNIKPFLNLYNWAGIEHPTIINEKNYTFLKKKLIRKLP